MPKIHSSVMDLEEVPRVWGHSQVGVNFTAVSGLGLPFELIGFSGHKMCRMKKRTNIPAFADLFF